ncbi:hypothetical protein EOM89_04300, partial [Candidatus Falkowbacteria bacterium]|nr:hypothetical protein [Candidatus Falkowbacteria bacterium]
FSFYTSQPGLIPAGIQSDRVFPFFIVNQLPVGVTGLLIASIFAAGMSTISTSLNSSATVILTDYFKKSLKSEGADKKSMKILYTSTFLFGLVSMGIAIAMMNVQSVLDAWWKLASIFSGGMLGQIDSHLYLMPGDQNKYGLFLSLADVDGREATIGMAGVEGIFAITETTRIEARGGIGYARPGSIDFIAASLGVDHDLGPRDTLFATLSVSEFDEVSLRGQGYDAEIGWRHALASHPVELTAAVGVSGMSGRDDLPSETRVSLGLTWRFGAEPGRSRTTATQAFRPVRPFDPLLLTGSF